MNYVIIMPAYNESQYIQLTIDSLIHQTLLPSQLVIVNDNSTDNTAEIVNTYTERYPWITLVTKQSDAVHLPGSKVIQAFYYGLDYINQNTNYDFIVKLDADLILPDTYFETIADTFNQDTEIGLVGGFAYIEKDNNWILESLTDKDHVRGAFKAYRKACFEEIGGLKPAMGWDTVDELLCHFYSWKVKTIERLKVKHLKPTGAMYNATARYKQGEAFYRLNYGIFITSIAAVKLAHRKKRVLLAFDYLKGYYKAKKENQPFLVTEEQGVFIRKYRWSKMKQKLNFTFFNPKKHKTQL